MKKRIQWIYLLAFLCIISSSINAATTYYKKSKAGSSAAYPASTSTTSVSKISKLGKVNSSGYIAKKSKQSSRTLATASQNALSTSAATQELSASPPPSLSDSPHDRGVHDEFIVINPGGQVLSGNGAHHGNAWWKNPGTTSTPTNTGSTPTPTSGTPTQTTQVPLTGTGQIPNPIQSQQAIPYPRPSLTPHQVPQQVPQPTPQAQPYRVPQPIQQQVPNQVPQQVPQPTPQAQPYRVPQPIQQQVPNQVPQQVPQPTPQAQPVLAPQPTQQAPYQVPYQVPQATPTMIPTLTPAQITQVNNLNINFNRDVIVVGQGTNPPHIPYQMIVTQNTIIFVPQYNHNATPGVNLLTDFDSINQPFRTPSGPGNDFHLLISEAADPTKSQLLHYQSPCGNEKTHKLQTYKDSCHTTCSK